MKRTIVPAGLLLLALSALPAAQDAAKGSQAEGKGFDSAASGVQQQLKDAVDELAKLREQLAAEKVPLSKQLSDLEGRLTQVRQEFQDTSRLLDGRTLDLTNLGAEIKARHEEASYVSNLLSEYARNFEAGLHVTELQRYRDPLQAAKLAPENGNLSQAQIWKEQTALLSTALDRLEDGVGGTRFEGSAVGSGGLVEKGTFVLVGPAALFLAADGREVGTAEQRLGSLEPAVIGFEDPVDATAARALVQGSAGSFPLDPSLGNAHKIEETHETLIEHIEKGGPVMIPIFVLAGAALLVVLVKWISLLFVRLPSRKRVEALLSAVGRHDRAEARHLVAELGGPVGRMLSAGVEHLGEPRELIEEVMFETVLTTRLRLERWLPFIAISASSAPLLGLLGTVTGIINTFKLITVFGSGDVKTLSGGISEALITTEYGLIVAIPSLLLHAFLSRKARGVINRMETVAVAFVNQISKSPWGRDGGEGSAEDLPADPDAELVPPLPQGRRAQGKEAVHARGTRPAAEHGLARPGASS